MCKAPDGRCASGTAPAISPTAGGPGVSLRLFDRFALARWIDGRAEREKGFFRSSLMTEVWIVLLL